MYILTTSLLRCDKGRRGSQSSQNLVDIICGWPLPLCILPHSRFRVGRDNSVEIDAVNHVRVELHALHEVGDQSADQDLLLSHHTAPAFLHRALVLYVLRISLKVPRGYQCLDQKAAEDVLGGNVHRLPLFRMVDKIEEVAVVPRFENVVLIMEEKDYAENIENMFGYHVGTQSHLKFPEKFL